MVPYEDSREHVMTCSERSNTTWSASKPASVSVARSIGLLLSVLTSAQVHAEPAAVDHRDLTQLRAAVTRLDKGDTSAEVIGTLVQLLGAYDDRIRVDAASALSRVNGSPKQVSIADQRNIA